MSKPAEKTAIKYLTPEKLYKQIEQFTAGMAVTRGKFELLVERCTLEDMEWNHMDQQHRPLIHKTYDKGIRIALGKEFAVSLTQWGKWPFFITVTDSYVARGMFYQTMTIGGVIFLHSIISLTPVAGGVIMRNEWFIGSHKILKFMHKFLDKKLYKLNARLQEEDAQIRHGRYELRQQGFLFRSDPVDYFTSNTNATNTIYPDIEVGAHFSLEGVGSEPVLRTAGNLDFLIKQADESTYLVWPAVCPHEGGPLDKGTFCAAQVTCPWHGLRFSAVRLSATTPEAARYGFQYHLMGHTLYIKQTTQQVVCEEEVDYVAT